MTRLGERGLQLVLTALTPVGAALTAGACLRRLGAGRRLALGLAPWAALAASELLEPFRETLYEGQVNAVLMALVALSSSGRRGLLMTCPPPPSRGSQQFCPKLVVSRP